MILRMILKKIDSTDAKKRIVLCKEKQNNHKNRKISLPLVKLIKIKTEKIKIDKTKTRKGDVETDSKILEDHEGQLQNRF